MRPRGSRSATSSARSGQLPDRASPPWPGLPTRVYSITSPQFAPRRLFLLTLTFSCARPPAPIPRTLASPSSVYLASVQTYFHLFVLPFSMPPKSLAKPRSWGNRFDPLNQPRTPSPARQPASPLRIPATGFSASKLSPLQATFTPLNSSRRRDERTPHDASVFVGRYFSIPTSLCLIKG